MFFKKEDEAAVNEKSAHANTQRAKRARPVVSQNKTSAVQASIPNSQNFSTQKSVSSTPAPSQDDGRRLVVGRDISIAGQISSCEHLIVEGVVEAELQGGTRIDITQSGLFRGTVEIQDAYIAGRFEGELIVYGQLVVQSGGSIAGKVSYGSLQVDSGAAIQGEVSALTEEQQKAYLGTTQATEKIPSKTANNDDENIEALFNKTEEEATKQQQKKAAG